MPRPPYKWRSEYPRCVIDYARTDPKPSVAGVAELLNVSRETVYKWRSEYPSFKIALDAVLETRGTYTYGVEESSTDG